MNRPVFLSLGSQSVCLRDAHGKVLETIPLTSQTLSNNEWVKEALNASKMLSPCQNIVDITLPLEKGFYRWIENPNSEQDAIYNILKELPNVDELTWHLTKNSFNHQRLFVAYQKAAINTFHQQLNKDGWRIRRITVEPLLDLVDNSFKERFFFDLRPKKVTQKSRITNFLSYILNYSKVVVVIPWIVGLYLLTQFFYLNYLSSNLEEVITPAEISQKQWLALQEKKIELADYDQKLKSSWGNIFIFLTTLEEQLSDEDSIWLDHLSFDSSSNSLQIAGHCIENAIDLVYLKELFSTLPTIKTFSNWQVSSNPEAGLIAFSCEISV